MQSTNFFSSLRVKDLSLPNNRRLIRRKALFQERATVGIPKKAEYAFTECQFVTCIEQFLRSGIDKQDLKFIVADDDCRT